MHPRNSLLVAAALLALAAPLAAQAPAAAATSASRATAAPATPVEIYRREVFRYQRGGRPDPFQALLTAADLGFRVEDLRLTSIVYSPNPRMSLAVFAEGDSARRHRMRVGQRLGTMTVLRIYPQRVDVRVDEFGGSRTETIQLRRVERRAEVEAQNAPQGQQTVTIPIAPGAQQPAEARRTTPLRRGGAAQPQGQQPGGTRAAPAPAPTRTTNPRAPSYTRPRGQ